jgi:hypothetical protein
MLLVFLLRPFLLLLHILLRFRRYHDRRHRLRPLLLDNNSEHCYGMSLSLRQPHYEQLGMQD